MPTVQNTVERYARLAYLQERGRLTRTMRAEMLNIENEALAKFSPQQMDAALHYVNQYKFNIAAQEFTSNRAKAAQQLHDAQEKSARELTAGLFGQRNGLSSEQYREVRDTGKVTLPSNKWNTAEADEVTQESTRRIDPKGVGWTKAQWVDKLDALTNARNIRDHAEFERLAAGINMPLKELQKTADEWTTKRITFGLSERANKAKSGDDEVVEADDRVKRKVALTDAYLANVEDGKVKPADFNNSISKEYMQDDGLRGDVARAFASHESNIPVSIIKDAWSKT